MKAGDPGEKFQRHRVRILRFLAAGPVKVEPAASGALVLLDGGERGKISAPISVIEQLARDDLVMRHRVRLELSPLGISASKRASSSEDPFRDQHMDLDHRPFRTASGYTSLQVNMAESPLAQLARRKNRAGEPFLTEAEFLAGERLRSDYTRGQIMPRLGANWEASVSSGPRGGDDGFANLTDAALSARIRVDKALEAVGPELAGPLVDVCCFLKGLEQVEAERGWPARSAKLLLKTALAALSRHYEPVTSPHRQNILHWGTRDYKPSVQRG
jgi:hypothetical protein